MSGTVIPDPVISIGMEYRATDTEFRARAVIYVGTTDVYRTDSQEVRGIPDEPERVERALRDEAEARLANVLRRLLAEEANDGAT